MLAVPKLWRCLMRYVLADGQAWTLWRALTQARWSVAVEWRQQFVAFDRQPGRISAEQVEGFFGEHATPAQLVALIEALMQEGALLRRDGQKIEDAVLRQVTRHGTWRHQSTERRHAYG